MNHIQEAIFFKQEKDTKVREIDTLDKKRHINILSNKSFHLSFILKKVHNERFLYLDQSNNYLNIRWKFYFLNL